MDVDTIINACECALEQANDHSTSATDIWNSVKRFIPNDMKEKAAESLADHLAYDWKNYIEKRNVNRRKYMPCGNGYYDYHNDYIREAMHVRLRRKIFGKPNV